MLLLITTAYLKNGAKVDFKEWDFNTVTAGDFTIKFLISEA